MVIAVEINFFKEHIRKRTLINSIEIGRRLKEAKALLPHGEWGVWLEESVSYSQSTADRLMQLYDEYELKQPFPAGSPAADAWAQALLNLGYSQALVLIGLPEEERLDFINDLDVDNMSVRELKKAVEQRKEAMAKCDKRHVSANRRRLGGERGY